MCHVNTVLGVLYLILIVYYIINFSGEELSIIFQNNTITMLIRYVYRSKAKENAPNDTSIQYKRSVSFTKKILLTISQIYIVEIQCTVDRSKHKIKYTLTL